MVCILFSAIWGFAHVELHVNEADDGYFQKTLSEVVCKLLVLRIHILKTHCYIIRGSQSIQTIITKYPLKIPPL